MSTRFFFLVFTCLYLAQGLPAGLIVHALPAILRDMGLSLAWIGLLKLLALPWLLKFIWAPLIDQHCKGQSIRRVNWVISMQLASAVCLVAMVWPLADSSALMVVLSVLLILLLNTLCATQDIATDSLAVQHASAKQLGYVNSLQVSGYKVGMILGGSGLLMLAALVSWELLLILMAALLVLLLLPVMSWRKRLVLDSSSSGAGFGSGHAGHTPAPLIHTKQSHFAVIWGSYRDFFGAPAINAWIAVLLSYKVADSFGSTMLKPMLVDYAWSLPEIGHLTLQSSLVGLVGAALGGVLFARLGRANSLWLLALLQGLAISSFYLIAVVELSKIMISVLVCMEQFFDGLSTVALFACMMHHCRDGHEGGDYTIQASIQILLAGLVGALSGVFASVFGYSAVYIACAVMSVVALILIWRYLKKVDLHES